MLWNLHHILLLYFIDEDIKLNVLSTLVLFELTIDLDRLPLFHPNSIALRLLHDMDFGHKEGLRGGY